MALRAKAKPTVTRRTAKENREIRQAKRSVQATLARIHDDIAANVATTGPGTPTVEIRREIHEAFRRREGEWNAAFVATHEQGYRAGRSGVVRRYGLDVDADTGQDTLAAHQLRQQARRMATVTRGRMVDDIAEAVAGAYGEGLGTDDVVRTLHTKVFADMRGYEADRIARMNTIQAANEGQEGAIRESDRPGKQWVTAGDSNVRDSHAALDGMVVPADGVFYVGGYPARYPGDGSLPLHESANCRCGLAPADLPTDPY